ncbi:MAG: hypothetical protein LAP85_28835 [Acidobacteriia bacterium]|nr:hypothetical protein [Terriglobia bacterium]
MPPGIPANFSSSISAATGSSVSFHQPMFFLFPGASSGHPLACGSRALRRLHLLQDEPVDRNAEPWGWFMDDARLRESLIELLKGGSAHVTAKDAINTEETASARTYPG